MKSFHEGCLQKFGDLSSEVSKLHAKAIAKSSVGWSCYKCVRLIFLQRGGGVPVYCSWSGDMPFLRVLFSNRYGIMGIIFTFL